MPHDLGERSLRAIGAIALAFFVCGAGGCTMGEVGQNLARAQEQVSQSAAAERPKRIRALRERMTGFHVVLHHSIEPLITSAFAVADLAQAKAQRLPAGEQAAVLLQCARIMNESGAALSKCSDEMTKELCRAEEACVDFRRGRISFWQATPIHNDVIRRYRDLLLAADTVAIEQSIEACSESIGYPYKSTSNTAAIEQIAKTFRALGSTLAARELRERMTSLHVVLHHSLDPLTTSALAVADLAHAKAKRLPAGEQSDLLIQCAQRMNEAGATLSKCSDAMTEQLCLAEDACVDFRRGRISILEATKIQMAALGSYKDLLLAADTVAIEQSIKACSESIGYPYQSTSNTVVIEQIAKTFSAPGSTLKSK